MGQAALVGDQIEEGQKLIDELIRNQVPVSAAFWVRTSEEGEWYLYFASPAVEQEGLRAVYKRLHAAMKPISPLWIDRFQVRGLSDSHPIVKDVLGIRASYSAATPIRYRGTRLGDLEIEEAIIYPPMSP